MELLGILSILLFVLLIGTPISFGLGFVSIVCILIYLDPDHLVHVTNIAFDQGTSVNQLVAPMFILMAEILVQGGTASNIFNVMAKWTRKLRGGLAISTTIACTVFAALCGSSPATAASIGRISIIEMTKRNYSSELATGTVAAGGTLGIMIPPSMAMILFGITTENSIAKLFIAGVLPGLLISGAFMIYILIMSFIVPSSVGASKEQKAATAVNINEENFSLHQIMKDVLLIFPPVILVVVVLGVIYSGLATPTEAAGIGVIGALILLVTEKRENISLPLIMNILFRASRTAGMMLFLIFGGMTLSYVVSYIGIAQSIADGIIALGLNKYIVVTAIYGLWIVLGTMLDPVSIILLTVPFLYTTLLELGFHPYWMAVVSTLTVGIGMLSPPVGLNLFVIKGICDVPMDKIIIGTLPFIGVMLICLVILTIFPEISTYLPLTMK